MLQTRIMMGTSRDHQSYYSTSTMLDDDLEFDLLISYLLLHVVCFPYSLLATII